MACSEPFSHPELITALSTANAKFARDVYRIVTDSSDDGCNFFMSPYSILSALSIACLGAQGDTAAEMWSVLKLTELCKSLQDAFKEYITLLRTPVSGCHIFTANKLFVRKDKKICEEYLQQIMSLGADAVLCDFAGRPDFESSKINEWIASETQDKIQNVITPSALSKETSILIVNAIYFKGTWMSMFDPSFTRTEQFTVSSSKHVSVDMMYVTDSFGYEKFDDMRCTALELPYKDNNFSMIVLLPFENDGLSFLESTFSASTLQHRNFTKTEVHVSMPRFKMESSLELTDVLMSLGLKTALDPDNADFKGIDPSGTLILSSVLHKSCVEVNEYGTEAAACTMLDVLEGMCLREEIYFQVDHPFLFLIRDNRCDMILFMGRLVDPEGLQISQPRSEWDIMAQFDDLSD